ncbi:MFS transporter [Sutterella sp.]|uniref:MFS transporter n=1 Tax=Sutterella sp. TaxID=1981025 RepID=UPI0026E052C0|nr:MFS transporter [Sutterella sp.]MDO5532608.1 MFS transporter [Sutterella sp.]
MSEQKENLTENTPAPAPEPSPEEKRAAEEAARRARSEHDGKWEEPHELDFSKKGRSHPEQKVKEAIEGLDPEESEQQKEILGNWKTTLAILTAASVLMSLSYTMLIPFLPMYLLTELHVSNEDVNLWSGLVFSCSFIVSGVMAPIWGAMADKRSKKLMAVRAAILLSVSYGLSGLVQNEWQLLGVRMFQGFASGLWPACLAIISSSVPKTRLGLSMGTMQSGMTAGGVIGPLFGGILAEMFGMRATFFLGAAALFIITLMIIFKIKEPVKKKVAKNAAPRPKTNLLKVPVVQRMLITAGVVQLTILLLQPVLPMYVGELQGSMDRIVFVSGLLFSVVGISGVIASPLWGIAGQKWGYRPALYLALLGSGIFAMIQAIPDTLIPFGIWRFIGGLTFAGIFPAINAVLTNSTGPEDRGRIFGLSYAAQQIGSVIGPILGGVIAMYFGIKVVVFLTGFLLIPMVVWLYLKRPDVDPCTKGVAKKIH